MDTIMRRKIDRLTAAFGAVLLAAALVLALAAPASAEDASGPGAAVTLAATQQERRPIAPTQRDQLGLALYGFMALVTFAGVATLRRQLKGERPQSDGEFRWR